MTVCIILKFLNEYLLSLDKQFKTTKRPIVTKDWIRPLLRWVDGAKPPSRISWKLVERWSTSPSTSIFKTVKYWVGFWLKIYCAVMDWTSFWFNLTHSCQKRWTSSLHITTKACLLRNLCRYSCPAALQHWWVWVSLPFAFQPCSPLSFHLLLI